MPELFLADENATEKLGQTLAKQTPPGGTWLLRGELGAGKTTWTRGFVAGLGGDPDQVSSPTYAVLHRYEIPTGNLFHLDLFRLGTTAIWSLGLEDCITQEDRLVVEWGGNEGPWPIDWISHLELTMLPNARKAVWYGSIADMS